MTTALLNTKNVCLTGAPLFTPPEVIRHSKYHADPAYVWAIGVVLFEILHGFLPFGNQDEILRDYVKAKPTLSSGKHDRHLFTDKTDMSDRKSSK